MSRIQNRNKKKSLSLVAVGIVVWILFFVIIPIFLILVWFLYSSSTGKQSTKFIGNTGLFVMAREKDWNTIILSSSMKTKEFVMDYPFIRGFVVSEGNSFVFYLVKKNSEVAVMRFRIDRDFSKMTSSSIEEILSDDSLKDILVGWESVYISNIFSASSDANLLLLEAALYDSESRQREVSIVLVDLSNKSASVISAEFFKERKCLFDLFETETGP